MNLKSGSMNRTSSSKSSSCYHNSESSGLLKTLLPIPTYPTTQGAQFWGDYIPNPPLPHHL